MSCVILVAQSTWTQKNTPAGLIATHGLGYKIGKHGKKIEFIAAAIVERVASAAGNNVLVSAVPRILCASISCKYCISLSENLNTKNSIFKESS